MKRSQTGLSLIELMVALALGLVVTLGVLNIFIASKNTYLTQNAGAAMQEDARYVLSKMAQEIRMVGMFGCLATITAPSTNASVFTAAHDAPISYTTSSAGNVLTLTTADVGTTGGTPTWTVLSDCVTSATAYNGTATPASGQIKFPIHQVVYTYKNNVLYTGSGTSIQPLISNVSVFDVTFGLAATATDTLVSSYSATATNPALIRSVRISLTLTDPNITATTRMRDQTFNIVAALRNRLP